MSRETQQAKHSEPDLPGWRQVNAPFDPTGHNFQIARPVNDTSHNIRLDVVQLSHIAHILCDGHRSWRVKYLNGIQCTADEIEDTVETSDLLQEHVAQWLL